MSFANSRRGRVLRGTAALLALVFIAAAEEPSKPQAANAEKLAEARDLLEAGQFNEAVKVFKEADKLADGSCPECRLGLARAFNKLGAFRSAMKEVEATLKQTSDNNVLMAIHNEKGVALVALAQEDPKQLAEAEKAFRQVLELSDGKANSARFNLGYTLLRMSRDEEGIAVLKEYLAKDPNAASAAMAKDLIANPLRARKRLVPEFELVTLSGEYLTAEEVKGKVVLFDFWGTWCAPCVAALPGLRSLARRMEDQPFLLVSVSTDADEAVLREFIAKQQMTWPQVWDKHHEFTRKCQVQGFPTYMLVSPEGEILYSVRGWSPIIERDVSAKVSSALRAVRKAGKQGG
ncbi:MAG TPA: redoxin domain-containing protein [Thermoanaerobaculia bacterium]|jgi:thioredoxin-like negative regulator of GroEL|nr:redoxin domain-containing protein [Thermoanaerobaculia bacterium]